MSRTRVKICGLTRAEDLRCAVGAGADAIGLVFYSRSPRCVSIVQARSLSRLVPPFVTRVGLFANAEAADVRATIGGVPLDLLQFHGDEDDNYCAQFGRGFIKAIRVGPDADLLKLAHSFPSARALLFDAHVEGYGGGGKTFDWELIPGKLPAPLIISGGLDAANVGAAIRRLAPWAVDVSSGVESAKGIKDAAKIAAFVAAVKDADA